MRAEPGLTNRHSARKQTFSAWDSDSHQPPRPSAVITHGTCWIHAYAPFQSDRRGLKFSFDRNFVSELNRRNVFRVAVAYLAASWLLVEVLSVVVEVYGAPQWVLQVLIALLAIGFTFAIVFSWAYEITPEGLKREKDGVRDESITHLTAKRLAGPTQGRRWVAWK